jgi:hypothetical protein
MAVGRPAAASGRLDRGIIVVSSVVVIGAFMSILDTTIVNVALATLSRELGSPLHTIQWVATGYLSALLLLTDVTAVHDGWDTGEPRPIRRATPDELRARHHSV